MKAHFMFVRFVERKPYIEIFSNTLKQITEQGPLSPATSVGKLSVQKLRKLCTISGTITVQHNKPQLDFELFYEAWNESKD